MFPWLILPYSGKIWCFIAVQPNWAHFRIADFVRQGEHYHVARVELRSRRAAVLHDHDFYEVFWVESGRGKHWCNGEVYPLRRGQCWLIRPADRHRVTGESAHAVRIVNVAFSGRVWAEVRRRYFADQSDPFEQPLGQRHRLIDGRWQAELDRWAERLTAPARPRVVIDGFLMELPTWLALPSGGSMPEALPEWLAHARREIARPEHFAGGTPAFAKLAGRSASHVARETDRWLGQTPTELVNAARMDYFARALATSRRPIVDLALDCGLNNLSHAYALFRRRFGVSPHRYRLRAHGIV